MKDKLKDKMKKKFTDLSISHKMLMVYITFASAFLLIALGLTQISFRIYSKELYDKSLQELDYFSQNVNRGLKDAERNNYSISMDALVQRTLSDLSVLEYPSLDYNQKIRDLRRILLNEYDPESCVKSIIFVDLYGNTVEVGTAAWDVSGESFTAIKKQMEQGKGAYTTYGPTEECPYLLSGRVVRNRLDMSLSDMGKLIFVCDVGNVISENKESLSSNKAAIYVYNKNCAIYEDENIKKLDDLPKYVEHSGYKILKQSGRKYFVSYLYSAKTDWTYVSFFPYSDIYGQVQTVRTLLILGFLAVFTALVFFMKKLSVVIVSPLEHLTDSMQIVENGDFQGAREMLTNTDRQDEIGTLSREFRTMLETVDTLIHENYEKQLLLKDTKYKMLRAQINPHFLYNTLNVIHWMIRAKRNEEAGRMIVELGDILHYSFSQTPYAIISDEIKMVKSYIKIQQSRYQDRIKFEIFTEGALDKYIMPRMILQPLVENAISYGAEVSLDICTITVSVRENADAIVMEVIDDGVGMSEEELEAVRSYTFKPKGHGIGLKNISERLKMDDENSIFYIDSVPDIVLTDIKMPVMNGIELIQKLSETYRNIVVVVLSGYGEYEFTSQAMEYGIRHYILKPCDEDKIVAVMNDAKKEVDKRREYHTLKRELLPHAKEELFRRLLTGSRLSDDEIMALKKDFPANGDSYRLLAMKNEVSGFEYIEQFILGNILGEILQMATMPLFTYVDDMVIFAIDVCTDNSLSKAVERTLQEFARMKSKAIASAASLEGDISVAHELYKQLLYLFTMVDNKTDAGLLCYPTQNEAESNTYYFDFDRLKSSDRYDNILFEITLAMKKLQSIGLSNDEKQRIFEAFIVTWSSYVGSEKLKLLNIGGINSDESAITEVSRWIAETLNIYETGKEKERMEKILDVIYSNFDNTELNIQYIAKNILFMNEDYFGRVFIRNMHLKFSAYLEQSRIEMAKRLLEYNPDMRIAMLTELIGYPADGQYFSKTFRKVCGMTPTEYRENLKKTDI